jgi:hypothetical protein
VKLTNSHSDGGFHPPYNGLTGHLEQTLSLGFVNPLVRLDSHRLEVLLNGDSFIIYSGSATGIDRDAFKRLGPPGRSRPWPAPQNLVQS